MKTCKCNHCPVDIEYEDDVEGSTVTCPSCGMETLLSAALVPQDRVEFQQPRHEPKKTPGEPASPPPVDRAETSKRLDRIRRGSAYGSGRYFVDMMATFSSIFGFLCIPVGFFCFVASLAAGMAVMIGGVIVWVVAQIGKEIAFAVFDLADMAIDRKPE